MNFTDCKIGEYFRLNLIRDDTVYEDYYYGKIIGKTDDIISISFFINGLWHHELDEVQFFLIIG